MSARPEPLPTLPKQRLHNLFDGAEEPTQLDRIEAKLDAVLAAAEGLGQLAAEITEQFGPVIESLKGSAVGRMLGLGGGD